MIQYFQKVLGEGFAVVPEGNKIYAPLTGRIEAVFQQSMQLV